MSSLHPLAKGVPHPAPLRHAAPKGLVLAGLFAAPASWFLQLLLCYVVNGDRCRAGRLPSGVFQEFIPVIATMVTSLATAVCLAGLFAAYRIWQLTRNEAPGGHHQALTAGAGRTRFLGLCGMIASIIFLFATLFALLVPSLVSPCTVSFS